VSEPPVNHLKVYVLSWAELSIPANASCDLSEANQVIFLARNVGYVLTVIGFARNRTQYKSFVLKERGYTKLIFLIY